MGEPIALFPVPELDPAAFAAAQHEVFRGRKLRIGRSGTVHAVGETEWINGLTLPAPACHQGWSGLGAAGDLVPTDHEATCRKCRRLRGLPSLEEASGQGTLFTLG
ncbi:hypothetical protein [Amycolatopsis sp.]|uniref:hypothetical protein n=1 Tax=Amycolatopsis sp. TaxID=37632 RepID=UPI002CD401F4|nr:hypothetical protein [Amycolatopsis sp.]HVV08441.1 hypothetical protein [Amycolatopsis sp.]